MCIIEGLLKWPIVYLRCIRDLWCRISIIFIKQHPMQLWKQCVHIHYPKIHCHTGNVCWVVVHNSHVLISQFGNHISISQTHVLKYVFGFIIWSWSVKFVTTLHQIKIKSSSCVWVFQTLRWMRNNIQENIF